MNTKPLIGVMPIYDHKKGNAWMLNQYFDAIIQTGGIPVMLPLTEDHDVILQTVERMDGFLFTGGDDVDSSIYNMELTYSVDTFLLKDKMECLYIHTILEMNKPILGICRGLQILNAALGGTLYQDLGKEYQEKNLLIHKQQIARDQTIHSVTIQKESLLYSIIKKEKYDVNSLHHQAVREVAKPLTVTAVADDGMVEACEKPDSKFVLAVQWHPELRYMVEDDSVLVFEAFIKACID